MPSNVITINNHDTIKDDDLAWIVSDSKMEELIEILNKIGDKYQDVWLFLLIFFHFGFY